MFFFFLPKYLLITNQAMILCNMVRKYIILVDLFIFNLYLYIVYLLKMNPFHVYDMMYNMMYDMMYRSLSSSLLPLPSPSLPNSLLSPSSFISLSFLPFFFFLAPSKDIYLVPQFFLHVSSLSVSKFSSNKTWCFT